MGAQYAYGGDFFNYVDVSARRSAAKMVPLIAKRLKPASVLDVGCGRGVWVAEWVNAGVVDCLGIDGTYVSREKLAVPSDQFRPLDLSKSFDLGRKFDIVQSLEVAEHIAEASADIFVDNLCRHGEVILFSAAVPGQGGEMHVNEQPLDYWRAKLSARGYAAFDWVRPLVKGNPTIEPWYRYNSLLFASEHASRNLSGDVVATMLRPDMRAPDFAPISWRMRNALLRCLPSNVVHQLAIAKHKALNFLHR